MRSNTGKGKEGGSGGGGSGEEEDSEDDDEDGQGAPTGLEVKQFEMLSDLILIDLHRTPMLSLPEDALLMARSSDSTDAVSRPSTPTPIMTEQKQGAERQSRNPFKNMFQRRKNR